MCIRDRPKDTYEECSKLYAFCRVLDDLADANQDLEIKKERFKELKEIFKEIESYESLVQKSDVFEEEHREKDISRPSRWGGFIVKPHTIEFWVDQKNRLHKRELFVAKGSDWKKSLLSP